MIKPLCLTLFIVFLGGCTTQTSSHSKGMMQHGPKYGAHFKSAQDQQVMGMLMVHEMNGHLMLKGKISGLKPNGEHGFHIHETGDCSKMDFSSAGGHFNPGKVKHGQQDSEHHLGDLANLKADANGRVMVEMMLMDFSLNPKADHSIIGRAVVIHANPDDYMSQPAGNSGPRIACGVISEMMK
ncbi:superoxide dismutase family protein [Chitinibacter sp. GC72]|uniref:superoxide dismutase family protein n=1 Tax=Chitinibacter sp. GC72 TaxID=1526917 RepID=UPI0018DF1C31|nr:superoxide dismutase family protein [Chitinibacter sp. GC72]